MRTSKMDGEEESLAAAKRYFEDSVECANRQGRGLLRVAPGRRIWHACSNPKNRTAEAHYRLAPVYARFAEGFATRDLIEARDPPGAPSLNESLGTTTSRASLR